ncbi:hypothetical protein Glove_84g134 [Diversispora epigaea]|uniref:Serine-threonine/tyrosine-protein kinase catalytic domain-containing protein n=1 Tax=Diversispora epigaea TaxID=1348612 RepID=A0A397JI35_9GLOM|nr:hypothetical protein Glove_84g134 [Diversispora epigaea]
MSQEIEKIIYCSVGHSSEDFAYSDYQNSIYSDKRYKNVLSMNLKLDSGNKSAYSAELEKGTKWYWDFIEHDWKYYSISCKVALKEIKDFRYDIIEFLKVINPKVKYFGISKNPSTQNYIIVRIKDSSSCKLENNLILNANDKNNKTHRSLPYIPPEVLRGIEFVKKGDIYSFGGIMYEITLCSNLIQEITKLVIEVLWAINHFSPILPLS